MVDDFGNDDMAEKIRGLPHVPEDRFDFRGVLEWSRGYFC